MVAPLRTDTSTDQKPPKKLRWTFFLTDIWKEVAFLSLCMDWSYRESTIIVRCFCIVELTDAPATIPDHLLSKISCLSYFHSVQGSLTVILLGIRYQPRVSAIQLKSTKSEKK